MVEGRNYADRAIMNAKKAKKLRQMARAVAVNEKGESLDSISYLENTANRKFVTVEKVSGDGKSTYKDKEQIAMGTIKVAPRTVKGVYRHLKKQLAASL